MNIKAIRLRRIITAKNIRLNKFFFANLSKGDKSITIKPVTLVIRNLGYLKTFSQNIFIYDKH